jgi:hypothetical protein
MKDHEFTDTAISALKRMKPNHAADLVEEIESWLKDQEEITKEELGSVIKNEGYLEALLSLKDQIDYVKKNLR